MQASHRQRPCEPWDASSDNALFFSWGSFGSAGELRRLSDYLWIGEVEAVFEHLRPLTFSDAMLQNLNMFMIVGVPVTAVYTLLEHKRIRWLQDLVLECMPSDQGKRASMWLEAYLWTVSTAFVFVLLLAVAHIERPHSHYICAGSAFSCALGSIFIYLLAPLDLCHSPAQASGKKQTDSETEFELFTTRNQTLVRPVLKAVVAVHVAAGIAGAWKMQRLEDSRAALAFGITETAVIFGYQIFLAVFAVDDATVRQEKLSGSNVPEQLVKGPSLSCNHLCRIAYRAAVSVN